MKTNGLIEIIVYVNDMDRAVNFYRDNFGLNVTYPAGLNDYTGQFWVTLDGGGCVLALHGGADSDPRRFAPKIVFGVDDIHAARAELVANGVEVDEVRSAAPGVWVVDGYDPDRNPFSIEAHD